MKEILFNALSPASTRVMLYIYSKGSPVQNKLAQFPTAFPSNKK
jgi:hypothetical protein